MAINLFGHDSYDRPLGNRYLHGAVVPSDSAFLSTIEVEGESGIVYRRELRFASLPEAHSDLRTQLRVMEEVPLDDLLRCAQAADEYDEPFDWREHRRVSIANVPTSVVRRAEELLSQANEQLCGTSEVLDGFWIETHTIGCRNAADEPRNRWWDSHYKIYNEYVNDGESLVIGDPSEGKFVTATPQRDVSAGRTAETAENLPRAPDDVFRAWVGAHAAVDTTFTGRSTYKAIENAYRQVSYFAQVAKRFLNPNEQERVARMLQGVGTFIMRREVVEETNTAMLNDAVARIDNALNTIHSLVSTATGTSYDDWYGRRQEERGAMSESLLTYFVKIAGSVENYLQGLGAHPDVIQFVTSQPEDVAKKLVNEVRKNPQVNVNQLTQVAQALSQKQKYEPTQRESVEAFRYADVPGMDKWVLLQTKRYRAKKVETQAWGNFPPYEFEYKWPIPVEGRAAWSLSAIDRALHEIADWVNATGAQLSSYDLATAKAESDKWHEAQSAKGAGGGYQEKNVVFTLSNGWTIQQVRTANDLEVEGNLMGHCVGSYCKYVERGDSSIYSLRDPNNSPHATIEIEGGGPLDAAQRREIYTTPNLPIKVVQIQGKQNVEPIPEYKKMIGEWLKSLQNVDLTGVTGDVEELDDKVWREVDGNRFDRDSCAELGEMISSYYHPKTDQDGYGMPIGTPQRPLQAHVITNIYNNITQAISRNNRRDNEYHYWYDDIADGIAKVAWESDMRLAAAFEEAVDIQLANGTERGIDPNPSREAVGRRLLFHYARTSALRDLEVISDKATNEFDKFDVSTGEPYPTEPAEWDFESPEEYEKAKTLFQEEEAQWMENNDAYRDEQWKNWLYGGFVNQIWHTINKLANGQPTPIDRLIAQYGYESYEEMYRHYSGLSSGLSNAA